MKDSPFAKGTFRLAYYAQMKRRGVVTNMTAKAFIEPITDGDDSHLLSSIETQVYHLPAFTYVSFCLIFPLVAPLIVSPAFLVGLLYV